MLGELAPTRLDGEDGRNRAPSKLALICPLDARDWKIRYVKLCYERIGAHRRRAQWPEADAKEKPS